MKELLTLKEAAALTGRTTKTIKNYIKRGTITNYFLVEGKYGQEYRINLKDVEPLMKKGRRDSRGKEAADPRKNAESAGAQGVPGEGISPEEIYDRPEYLFLQRRNDEILMELGRCREKAEKLESLNLQLKQEAEEKDMLISMLMRKETDR